MPRSRPYRWCITIATSVTPRDQNPERFRVRLRAPPGIGSVQTFSGRHINVGLDGTIEMSAEDAQYYIRDGWAKLAEWTIDEAA